MQRYRMAYKRMRPGAYIGGRRYVRRKVRSRAPRRARTRRTRALTRPKYLFHRYVHPALPAWSGISQGSGMNWNTTHCTYSATTGILGINLGQTEAAVSCCFALSDLQNYTEFANLFDQYKINGVLFTIKMINTPEQVDAANMNIANYGNFYPTIWYTPDHDDNNYTPLSQIKEHSKTRHKVLRPNREISIMLKPTTLMQVYNTVQATGYACNFKKPWLDMAQPTIPHFGIKFSIDMEGLSTGTAPAQGFQFKINAKYYMSMKNAR